ncbi:MAG TPA: cytochrome c [Gemmatimonadaceae bacterium]|nr:cytochrome c [Gemmatimonadaceae bacterium]
MGTAHDAKHHDRRRRWAAVLSAAALAGALVGAADATTPSHAEHAPRDARSGEQIYRAACTGCHGADGTGAPRTTVGFAVPLPDFTDCNFASREADADWAAIIRDGGPVRGFSRIMPAFRDALSPDEIRRVIAYLRTFCRSGSWPRGNLNLPRALVTEKAFPEDEAVLTTAVNTHAPGGVSNALLYERRFGARDQLEVEVPFSIAQQEKGGPWSTGIGDLSLGPKHTFYHSRSSILSGAAGISLPTGDTAKGFGAGTAIVETYALFGQLLPANGYFQFQGGVELPTHPAHAPQELFWRGALGTTVPFGRISRTWSPMVEVLGTREMTAGAPVEWDIVPQSQLTLSARQHIRVSVGVDVPVTETDTRHPQILAYLLWDWFDGGLFEGWRGWCPGCQH